MKTRMRSQQFIHLFILGMFIFSTMGYPFLVYGQETTSAGTNSSEESTQEAGAEEDASTEDAGSSSTHTTETTEQSSESNELAHEANESSGEENGETTTSSSETSSSTADSASTTETKTSTEETKKVTTDITDDEHRSENNSEGVSNTETLESSTTYQGTEPEQTTEKTTETTVDTSRDDTTPKSSPTSDQSENSTTLSTPKTTPDETSPTKDTSTNDTTKNTPKTQITTGEAIAYANVLNIINSNFINSKGSLVFLNLFDNLNGLVDLRNYYGNAGAPQTCGTTTCHGNNLQVTIDNDATLINDINVIANSGKNKITDATSGEIKTGDAFALANTTNVVNTNFVDTSYLMVTMNTLGNLDGDLILPSLDPLIGSFLGPQVSAENILKLDPASTHAPASDHTGAQKTKSNSEATLDLTNDAEVTDTVSVDAETGGNSTSADGGTSSITTGNSTAFTNVFNTINTNLINHDKVTIMFRVHGKMAGNIYTPDNVVWVEEPDGSISFFQTSPGQAKGQPYYPLPNVAIDNKAKITNNVSVVALTGENHISAADSAVISTGHAYAGANITNVANTNVIGGNWIFAIINILGDFNGNVTFGSPDLWIGEQIKTQGDVMEDSEITYQFTVINNGDTSAKDIKLFDDYDEEHIAIIDSSHPYTLTEEGTIVWEPIKELGPQEAIEVTYTARVQNVDNYTKTPITNTVTIGSNFETNTTLIDNTDTATIMTNAFVRVGEGVPLYQNIPVASVTSEDANTTKGDTQPAQISITRVTEESYLDGSQRKAHQMIVLRNKSDVDSGPIVIKDILRDPTGIPVTQEYWNLGKVYAHEEIILTYDVQFREDAPPGQYEFLFVVEGKNYKLANTGVSRGYIFLDGKLNESYISSDQPITTSGNTINREGKKKRVAQTFTDALLPGQVLAAETSITEQMGASAKDTDSMVKTMIALINLLLIISAGMYVHHATRGRI